MYIFINNLIFKKSVNKNNVNKSSNDNNKFNRINPIIGQKITRFLWRFYGKLYNYKSSLVQSDYYYQIHMISGQY